MSNRLTVQPDDETNQWVPNTHIPNCTPGVPLNGKTGTIPITWTVPGTALGGGLGQAITYQELLTEQPPQPSAFLPKVWTGPKTDISTAPDPAFAQKPTNPKDMLGSGRIPLDLVSAIAIAEEALAMVEGALKYGKFNYRAIGVKASIYAGAALRHLAKWYNGQDRDPKTHVHHLGSARACLGVLLDAEALGKLTDDRPPANPDIAELMDAFEVRVKHLQALFTEYHPKHYTIADESAE